MKLWIFLVASPLLALPATTSAQAQAPNARDAYVGLGLGSLSYEIRSNGDAFFDTTSGALELYGGFRLGRNWGFEVSYQFTDSATEQGLPASISEQLVVPGVPGPLVATTTARIEIATLRALRFFRRDWGTWFVGVGVSGAAIDTQFEVLGAATLSANVHKSKNGLTTAAGIEWTWSTIGLRLGYEWWDADMSSIGLSLHRRL